MLLNWVTYSLIQPEDGVSKTLYLFTLTLSIKWGLKSPICKIAYHLPNTMTKSYITREMGTNFGCKAYYATNMLDMSNDRLVQTGRRNYCTCPFEWKTINIRSVYFVIVIVYLKETSDISKATKYAGVNLKYRYRYISKLFVVSDASDCFLFETLSELRKNKRVTNSPLKMERNVNFVKNLFCFCFSNLRKKNVSTA